MADFTMTMTIGANTTTKTVSPTNARMLQFLDDIRLGPFPEIDDGAGGTRPMTQTEVAVEYLERLMAGQVAWAKALRQDELDKAVVAADDLVGGV